MRRVEIVTFVVCSHRCYRVFCCLLLMSILLVVRVLGWCNIVKCRLKCNKLCGVLLQRHMRQDFLIPLCPVLVMSGLPLAFVCLDLFFQVAFCVYRHVGEKIK